MDQEIVQIAQRALKLSVADRAYIAEMLLESLDYEEDFPLSDEWLTEIKKGVLL